MSQQDVDVASPVAEHHQQQESDHENQDAVNKRLSSGTESTGHTVVETDHDSFEDAVDTSSVRSLTKRSVSVSAKLQPPTPDDEAANPLENHEDTEDREYKGDSDSGDSVAEIILVDQESATQRTSSSTTNRISRTSNLDIVDLNDDVSPTQEGNDLAALETCRLADHNAVPNSPLDKEESGKTISLGSITNALPALPWSPPAESPTKSCVPPAAAIAPPPQVHQLPPPPPPTRKLTSPFSWLSRNSVSKEKEHPPLPAIPSPRRNTASSIATLTSNPEMLLSRLEEENGDSLSADGTTRTSLRDRFKQLRLQQEPHLESDQTGLSLPAHGDFTGDKPLPSPVPSPSTTLAPGTMSGVNAGPSVMSETQVDWDLWQSVVYEGPAAVIRTSPEELNRAIASGIPNAIRGVVWQVLANSKNVDLELVYKELAARGTEKDKDRHSNSTTMSSLSNGNLSVQSGDAVTSSASSLNSDQSGPNGVQAANADKNAEALAKANVAATAERKRKDKEDAAMLQRLEKTIRRDLGARTSFSKYAASAGLQEGLFAVCKAYALFDEGVGYTQGMNFLIMPLLFNMPEQEAFCLLVRLMNHYKLRDLFVQDMPGLHLHLYQFERLLEDYEPALYCHLSRRGITPHLYATQWFLTLFAYRFPLQLVLRIYDLILSEGLTAILRFGIVLMQKNASTLLGLSDMQQLTTYLKDKLFDAYIDKDPSHGSLLENGFFGSSSSSIDKEVYRADQLVRDACEVKMTPEMLKAYTVEWEEKLSTEKDREHELRELRSANHNFAVKVRKLEERVEEADREGAALATELVRTKVENEELKDENESLNGQVRELKIVIEKQPVELEEKWTLERDNLMKRNENVHEDNQKLEKEMSELEEELVQTKMLYAEINSQHETLTRKWTELKRQFDS
ncbi:hypothetical protein G7046_g6279 [Stylonectria norvegica]|nr:hypothetical protein G7046_g6279 [Stylonectria norvegica]